MWKLSSEGSLPALAEPNREEQPLIPAPSPFFSLGRLAAVYGSGIAGAAVGAAVGASLLRPTFICCAADWLLLRAA